MYRLFFLILFGAAVVAGPAAAELATSVNTANVSVPQAANAAAPPGGTETLSRPVYNPSVFNPAMGLVVDAVARNTTETKGGFDFRSAELNLAAAVDPFANLYGIFNGTPDGVSVEEAFFMTTSLPANLTVRGGRFFANFGRLAHWHDHELPFVNRVNSLDRYVGAEAQADGLELMHLFKTPFFLQGTLGAYNKLGADNTRLDQTVGTGAGHTSGRPWGAFTYLGRLFSYVPLGDDYGLDVGVSEALTPRQYYINGARYDDPHSARSLTGIDLTFRWLPLANNVFRKLSWGSEMFRNNEVRQTGGDPLAGTATYGRKNAMGGYSYVEWRFSPRWSSGPFYDFSERVDAPDTNDRTYGWVLNLFTSEFARFRLQYSTVKANDGTRADHQVYLQAFLTIGSHVHVFKDR